MMPAASRIADAYTSLPRPPSTPLRASVSRPDDAFWHPAILAEPKPGGAVKCVACAHRCLIRPGRRGICGVRENRGGDLVSLVYGGVVAAAVEPIEKKPFFHAFPGSLAFSIATSGCNFHCRFCQNWEIAQAHREGTHPEVRPLPPASVVARAVAAGARSVAYTYVEPTVFVEYVVDTARLAREAGLANLLVTNGYQTPEALDVLGPLTDAANVDLKGFSDRFYRRVCGARLAPVLDALIGMRERGIWVEVTTLLVPGLNDDPGELRALAKWLVDELGPETPWHVSRFFPAYRMADLAPTPSQTIARTVEIGRAAGLRHVYSGNLGSAGDDDTACAACGEVLIRRRGFEVVANLLARGACPTCGHRLVGIGLAAA
jgi:pyruvate formate lyase activating enzyme